MHLVGLMLFCTADSWPEHTCFYMQGSFSCKTSCVGEPIRQRQSGQRLDALFLDFMRRVQPQWGDVCLYVHFICLRIAQ